MADDVIRDRIYDPTKDIPQQKKMTRREFLIKGGAVVTAGVTSGLFVGDKIISTPETSKTSYEVLLEQGIKPTQVFIGDVKITKGLDGNMLNVRSETNADPSTNITNWLNIEKFNGVNIRSVNEFIIKNALFVKGEDPDNKAGYNGKEGLWIVGNFGTNILSIKKEEPKYISYSSATGKLVKAVAGEFQGIVKFDKSGILTNSGENLKGNQLGIVLPSVKTT